MACIARDPTGQVVEFEVPRAVTPDDYDFPLTRKALRGQTQFAKARFVVTTDNGRKFFGAIPSSYEEGVKLVSRVKAQVPGSTPQLLRAGRRLADGGHTKRRRDLREATVLSIPSGARTLTPKQLLAKKVVSEDEPLPPRRLRPKPE